jgi:hypothetical protein
VARVFTCACLLRRRFGSGVAIIGTLQDPHSRGQAGRNFALDLALAPYFLPRPEKIPGDCSAGGTDQQNAERQELGQKQQCPECRDSGEGAVQLHVGAVLDPLGFPVDLPSRVFDSLRALLRRQAAVPLAFARNESLGPEHGLCAVAVRDGSQPEGREQCRRGGQRAKGQCGVSGSGPPPGIQQQRRDDLDQHETEEQLDRQRYTKPASQSGSPVHVSWVV